MENSKKEALKQFMEEWLKNKQAKRMKERELEEEEVCIEPFLFLDEDGNILDYKTLMNENEELAEFMNFYDLTDVDGDAEVCPGIEEPYIKEDEIEYMPLDEVQLNDEELEYYKSVAENIKPVNPELFVPCVVNGEERMLMDGLNCNIKTIPVLGVALVSPLNLEVLKLSFDSDMESESEMVVDLALKSTKQMVVYKFTLGTLLDNGLLAVVDNVELELSPVEYRGITKEVDAEELAKLFTM